MHTWNVGDFARILKDGETEYVRVKSLENDVLEATSQTTWETAVYDPETLEYIPPFLIDAELVKKLMRMEVPYSAIYGEAKPFDNARSSAPVQITLEDLRQAILAYVASGMSEVQFADEWFWPLLDVLYLDIGLDEAQNDPKAAFRGPLDFFTEYEAFAGAWSDLGALARGYEVDLHLTLQDIDLFLTNRHKPVKDRDFPVWVKRNFLHTWLRPDMKPRADETIQFLTQRFMNELLAVEDPFAMEVMAKAQEAAKAAAEAATEATPS